jgi:hypothetical protein
MLDNALTDLILQRIQSLLDLPKASSMRDGSTMSHLYMGTLTLASSLYGQNSPQVEAINSVRNEYGTLRSSERNEELSLQFIGIIGSLRDDVKDGLISSLQTGARGEVLADFVVMAQRAAEDDVKDVAAVLGCAALEDTLKRFAEINGLEVSDRDMSEVINLLKSKGLVKGPRGNVLSSFVTIRNKSFHAQFDKIDMAEVKRVNCVCKRVSFNRFCDCAVKVNLKISSKSLN